MSLSIQKRCEQISKRNQPVEDCFAVFNKKGCAQNMLSSYCLSCKRELNLNEEWERKRRYRQFLKAERRRILNQNVRTKRQKMFGRRFQPQRKTCRFKNNPERPCLEADTCSCHKIPKVVTKIVPEVNQRSKCKKTRFAAGSEKDYTINFRPKNSCHMIQMILPEPCSSNEKEDKRLLKTEARGNKETKKLKTCLRIRTNGTQTQTKMVEQAVEVCFENPPKRVSSTITFNQNTERSLEDLTNNTNNELYVADKLHNNYNSEDNGKKKKKSKKKGIFRSKRVPKSEMSGSSPTQTSGSTDLSTDSNSKQPAKRKKDNKRIKTEKKNKLNKKSLKQQKLNNNKADQSPPQDSSESKSSTCYCTSIEEEEKTQSDKPPLKMTTDTSLGTLIWNYFDFTPAKCVKAEEPSGSATDPFRQFAPYDAAPWPTPASCPFHRALRGLQIKCVTARNSGHYRNGLEAVVIKIAELETRISYSSLMSPFEEHKLEDREELYEFRGEQAKPENKICCNCKNLYTTLKTIEGIQKRVCFPALFESRRILINEILNNINHCKNKCAQFIFRPLSNLVCHYKNSNLRSCSSRNNLSVLKCEDFTACTEEIPFVSEVSRSCDKNLCTDFPIEPTDGMSLEILIETQENAETSTCSGICGKVEVINPGNRTSFCTWEDRGCNNSLNRFQCSFASINCDQCEERAKCLCQGRNEGHQRPRGFDDRRTCTFPFDSTIEDEVFLQEYLCNNDRDVGTQYESSLNESDCSNSVSSLVYCPIFGVIRGSSFEKSIDCFKIEDTTNYELEEGSNINSALGSFCARCTEFLNQNLACGSKPISNAQNDSSTIIRTCSTPSCERDESDVLTIVAEDTELCDEYDCCPRLRGGENKDEKYLLNNNQPSEENLSGNGLFPEEQQQQQQQQQQQNTPIIQPFSSLFTQEMIDTITDHVNNFYLDEQAKNALLHYQNDVIPEDLPQHIHSGGKLVVDDFNNLKEVEGTSLLVDNVENKVSQNKLQPPPNIETELQNIVRYINNRAKDLEVLVQSLDESEKTFTKSENDNKPVCQQEKELWSTDYTSGKSQNNESIKSLVFQNQLDFPERREEIFDRPTKIRNISGKRKESAIKNKNKMKTSDSVRIKKSGMKTNKEKNKSSNKLLSFKRSNATSNVFLNLLREVVCSTKFNEETLRTLKGDFWLNQKSLKHVEDCDHHVVPRSFLLPNEELTNFSEHIYTKESTEEVLKDNNELFWDKLKYLGVNQEKLQDFPKVQERSNFPTEGEQTLPKFKTSTNPFLEDMSCEEILSVPQVSFESAQKVKDFGQSDIQITKKEFRLVPEGTKMDYVNKKSVDRSLFHCISLLTKEPDVSATKFSKFNDKSGRKPGEDKAIAVYDKLLYSEFKNPLEENKSKIVEEQRCVKSCAVGPSTVDLYLKIKQEGVRSRALQRKVQNNKYLKMGKPSSKSTRTTINNSPPFTSSVSNCGVSSFQLREVNSHFELGVPITFDDNSSTTSNYKWKKVITKYLNNWKPSVHSDWIDGVVRARKKNNSHKRKYPYCMRGTGRSTARNKNASSIVRDFKRKNIKSYEKVKNDLNCSKLVNQNDCLSPDWFGIQAKFQQNSSELLEFNTKTDSKKIDKLNINELQLKEVLQKSFLTEFFMRSTVAAQCGNTVKNIWRNSDIQTTASLISNDTKPTQCEIDKSDKGEQCRLKENVRNFYIPQRISTKNIQNFFVKPAKNLIITRSTDSHIKCPEIKDSKEVEHNISENVPKGCCHVLKEVVVIFQKSDNVKLEHRDDNLCEEINLNKRLHGSDRTEFSHVNFNARGQNDDQVSKNKNTKKFNFTKTCGSDELHGPKETKKKPSTSETLFGKSSTRAQRGKQSDRLRTGVCSHCDCKAQRKSSAGIPRSSRNRSCSIENQVPVKAVSDSCSEKFDSRLQDRSCTCPKSSHLVKVDVKLQDSLEKRPVPERENTRSTGTGSAVFEKEGDQNASQNKQYDGKRQKGFFKCCKKKKANTTESSESADKGIQAMGLMDRKAQTVEDKEICEGDVIESKKLKNRKTKTNKKYKNKNKKDTLKQSKSLDNEDDYLLLSCRQVGARNETKNRKKYKRSEKLKAKEDCSEDTWKIRLVSCSESGSLDCSEELPEDNDSCQKPVIKIMRHSTNKISKADNVKHINSSEDTSENAVLLQCVDKKSKKCCRRKGQQSRDLLCKVVNRERGGECRNIKSKEVEPKKGFLRRYRTDAVYPRKDFKEDSTNASVSTDSSFICVEVATSTQHDKPSGRIQGRCKRRKKLCMCKESPYDECEHSRKFLRTCKCHNHNHTRTCKNPHRRKKNKPETGSKKMLCVKVDGNKKRKLIKSQDDDCVDRSLVCVRIPKKIHDNKEEYNKRKVLAEKSAQCTTASYYGPENLNPQTSNRYNIEQFFTPCDNYGSFTPRSNVRQQNFYAPLPPQKEPYFNHTIPPGFSQNYDCCPTQYSAYSKYGIHANPSYMENYPQKCFHVYSCNPYRNVVEDDIQQPKHMKKYSRFKIFSRNDEEADISTYRIYNNCTCASKPTKNDRVDTVSSTITACSNGRNTFKYYTCPCLVKNSSAKKPFIERRYNVIHYTDSKNNVPRVVRKKLKYVDSETSMESSRDIPPRFSDYYRKPNKNKHRKCYDERGDQGEREICCRRRHRHRYYDDCY